jgi:sulfatase maturation enzyme AslB (radical SAM superfamily)
MTDTYCARSWQYFMVDLCKLDQKMCCKTKWKPMQLGVDWFNGEAIRARRLDHLQGRQNKDCEHCWELENRNQWSPRLGVDKPDPLTDSLDSYPGGMLELSVGNTCDMACRYCDSRYSSIWASRTNDQANSKERLAEIRATDHSKQLIAQFYSWLEQEKHKLRDLLIQGGEPLLIPETYDILENIDWQDTNIQLNTNLNTPEHYMARIESTIDRLIAKGNRVTFRVSVDGKGDQNDWQRQNSNWDRWCSNWFRLGSRPVVMKPALTLTPLTIEGMPGIGEFVLQSRSKLSAEPAWEIINVVTWPRPFDPTEWFGSYKAELTAFYHMLDQQPLTGQIQHIKNQITRWLNSTYSEPSYEKAKAFVDHLDDSQRKWGGGDWRTIYPKTAAIAQRVLEQAQP